MGSLLNVSEYCTKFAESSKIKDKKDILKQIPTLLDVPKVVQQLDANTLVELSSNKSQVFGSQFCTWSTLVKCLISVERNKRASYKKELPDALKIVIKTADQRGPRLFKCANDFFKHICETLEDDELYKCFSTDYSQILLDLVQTPGYAHLMRPRTFESLLAIYTHHLLYMDRGSAVDAAYDPNLNARLLLALITSCPFDLASVFSKLVKFFEDFFARYPNGSKISVHLLSTINHLLISCGPNVGRATLAGIYPSLHKFSLSNSTTTQIQLKEQIYILWRILLRLDVDFAGITYQPNMIVPKDNLQAIVDVVLKDLNTLHSLGPHLATRKPLSRHARDEANLHLDSRTKLVLELAADVLMRIYSHATTHARSNSTQRMDVDAQAPSDSENTSVSPLQAPLKRRRLQSLSSTTSSGGTHRIFDPGEPAIDAWDFVLGEVCAEKAASPHLHTYTQLLWVLITQHAREVPRELAQDIATCVAGALERLKDKPDTEVWLLRVLEALASASHQGAPHQSTWSGVWHLAVRRVHAANTCAEFALQVLRSVLRLYARSHAHLPFTLREVWKSPIYEEEHFNSQGTHMGTLRATLELLVDSSSILKPEERERLAKWVMGATEYLCRLEYSTLHTGGRVHLNPPPFAVTLAQAQVLVACFLNPQQKIQLKPTPPETEDSTDDLLHNFKTYRPLFDDAASAVQEILQVSSGQLPQSVQTRIHKLCLARLQSISTKLINDCQDIASSKKKTLGINKSHLCANLTDVLYFLQVLSHIENLTSPQASPSSYLSSPNSQSSQKSRNSQQTSAQPSLIEEVRLIHSALAQTIAEHFSNACKTSDAKLLASLFTRTDMWLQLPQVQHNHSLHGYITTISTALFAYLKDTVGLSSTSSSQISSPVKSKKKKPANSTQDADVFDLVDEETEERGTSGMGQGDLCLMVIRALARVSPCSHGSDSFGDDDKRPCGIGSVEEKLAKILENAENSQFTIEICEGILSEDNDKVIRHHGLLLNKALGMLRDPLFASDAPVRKHVLKSAARCASSLNSKHYPCDEGGLEAIQGIFNILNQLWYGKKLHVATRVQVLECLHVLIALEGLHDFELLSVLLLDSLSDSDIRVRMAGVPAVLVFFTLFEDEERIFSDINKRLLTNKKTPEGLATIFSALVAIAHETYRSDPAPLLRELCVIASQAHQDSKNSSSVQTTRAFRALAMQASTRIAHALGMSSPRHLIESHLALLLASWLSEQNQTLTNFPFYMLECDSFVLFLQGYGGYVVAQAVLMKDEAALNAVAQTLSTTPPELLTTHFTRVFAACFPLYYQSANVTRAAEICEKFMHKFIDETSINTLIPASFNDLLSTLLLDTLSFSLNPVPPLYSPNAVQSILEHLAKGWTVTLPDLLYRSRHNDRIQQVVLAINVAIARSQSRRGSRMRLLNSFAFFVGLLSDKLVRAPVLRETILTLLRVLHYSSPSPAVNPPASANVTSAASPHISPASSFILTTAPVPQSSPGGADWPLIERACEILKGVCEKALKSREGVKELCRELNAIVTTLVPLVQSTNVKLVIETLITAEYIGDTKTDDENANNSNDQKAEQINRALNEAIRKLDPLPDSVGTALRTALEVRRGGSSKSKDEEKGIVIINELARLTDLPTPSNPSARLARLNNIHSTLSQLGELERKSTKAQEYTNAVKWGKLVRQLVEICRKGDVDSSVVVLATECLGSIPYARELNEFSAQHSANASNLNPHSPTSAVHEKILEMLNTYLADYDMEVVCEAANCLRSVLRTETGAAALKSLAGDTSGPGVVVAEYLAPFTSKKLTKSLVPQTNRNSDQDILSNDSLWIPFSASLPSHSLSNSPFTSSGNFSMPASPFSTPHPFLPNAPSSTTPTTPTSPPSSSSSSASSTLGPLPSSAQGHTAWICKLASALATSTYVHDDLLRLCGGVCAVRPDFAEFAFPYLIFDVLVNDSDKGARVCKGVLKYFTQLLQLASKGSVPRESVLLTLNTLNFLRTHAMKKSGDAPPPAAHRFWHANFWDDIDYVLVSRAALRVGAHCTALLYMELWYEAAYGQVTLLAQDGEENASEAEDSSKSRVRALRKRTANGKSKPQPTIVANEEGQREARELLLEIFTSIGEPDSFYGLTATFDSIAPQLAMYVHEQNWPKAIGTYDMVLQFPSQQATPNAYTPSPGLHSPRGNSMLAQSNNFTSPLRGSNQFGMPSHFSFHEGLMTSLQNMGHYHILDFYLKGFQKQYPNVEEALSEYKSQSAWRSGLWDITASTSPGLHSSVHQSLRALSLGDFASFKDALDSARLDTVRSLSAESTTMNISPTLAKLRFLAEIDHAWESKWGSVSWHPHKVYTQKSLLPRSGQDFNETEPVYALYTVLAPLVGKEKELPGLLAAFSAAARKARRFQLATHAVYQLKSLASSSSSSSSTVPAAIDKQMAEAKLEEAKVLWGQGEETKGLAVVRHLLKAYKTNDKVRAEALLYTGKWLAHTRAERANIVEEYLNNAIHQYTQHGGEGIGKAHLTLAHYSDSLYQGLLAKAASSEWAATTELRQHKERELALCEKTLAHAQGGGLSADKKVQLQELTRHTLVLRRVVEGDRQDSQRLIDDTNAYLVSALTHYIDSLLQSDKYNVRAMFRVCSLWFNNSSSNPVNTLMREKGAGLPAYKFLPLIYQITSRVSANPSQAAFQAGLCSIIERVAAAHPHHVLYQLFALKNGEIEHSGGSSTRGKGAGKKEFVVDEDKVRAAKTLLARMQRGSHAQLINELSTLISAYIALTLVEHNSSKKPRSASYALPSVMTRITSLTYVVVPTLHADSRVKVAGFSPIYTLCGGRSAPKIVECIGDDGKKYRQLVKGKDDLRQDAVMQQTFTMVNTILSEAPATASRHLHVRTYKVLPLTHCAGLLEWVSNTIPLGGYLVGPQGNPQEGAHCRYRPHDKLSMEVWNAMSNAKEEDKLARFQECTEQFRPVFHHFFLEHFGSVDPATWHAKRLNYTHSVASNSIVGYIVGLGDRHAHNILIDCGSAELVHIDLGVAFEQGKMLRVPELVPFRLTRDIEDGMGITEERDVDAEIEDAESNDATKKDKASSGNKDAERALLRLKQKLQGIEYGETLSVEGQVHTLINEARDPERLCKMYPGWAAWV